MQHSENLKNNFDKLIFDALGATRKKTPSMSFTIPKLAVNFLSYQYPMKAMDDEKARYAFFFHRKMVMGKCLNIGMTNSETKGMDTCPMPNPTVVIGSRGMLHPQI